MDITSTSAAGKSAMIFYIGGPFFAAIVIGIDAVFLEARDLCTKFYL